ncbi:polysaccharide pyruvyl transferase domain protein [Leptospira licerasiae str. MMD4847]|uniref:Polysaccharide pyruvyl transferase domain protein n=1 Tax=Leptospira licerasiae str. MMD4847 TaxID=1049971 RepID=A0ABP2R8B1_9LEPT|nr:polysaccharide pyruvyl transferase domain protein [Leptospira licerasiae str. MMD4847]
MNPWLWPLLFGQEDESDGLDLVGIGSILFNNNKIFSKDRTKIVFGSGVRPMQDSFKPSENWRILFLRGPLSSSYLNNNYPHISDAAYCIRHTQFFKGTIDQKKKYEISFMPHYQSLDFIDWERICRELKIHFISSKCELGVEYTLREIAASKFLVTEAMHGAILADAFRVPWHRFILSTPYTEGPLISEFKWNDWLLSINKADSRFTGIKLYEKYLLGKMINRITANRINIEFFAKNSVQQKILRALSQVEGFALSDSEVINKLDTLLEKEIEKVKEFQKSSYKDKA